MSQYMIKKKVCAATLHVAYSVTNTHIQVHKVQYSQTTMFSKTTNEQFSLFVKGKQQRYGKKEGAFFIYIGAKGYSKLDKM